MREKKAILSEVSDSSEKTSSLNFVKDGTIYDKQTNSYAYPDYATKVVIKKPTNLKLENIRENINIFGVVGALREYTLENRDAYLDMASGDQTIRTDSTCLIQTATINKPYEFAAENIKYGVTIGGITGTYRSDIKIVEKYVIPSGYSDQKIREAGTLFYKVTVAQIKPEPNDRELKTIIRDGYNVAGVNGTFTGAPIIPDTTIYNTMAKIRNRYKNTYIEMESTVDNYFYNGFIYKLQDGNIERSWQWNGYIDV